ncbi:MAG: electron transport complex subunit RsxC, partial [Candidatus Omnitrophota bacterium]
VFPGQKIAGSDALVSACVHASIPGKVSAIVNWPHPVLGICKAIVIDALVSDRPQLNGGIKPAPRYSAPDNLNPDKLTPDQIRQIVRESGIVGMGGAGFPTHIKLNPSKPVDTLILNGTECEPYLTGDDRLMIEKADQILKGLELIVRCLGVEQIYIAIENNKPEAIKSFNSILSSFKGKASIKLAVLKSEYPQGGEKQLIKNILKKEVPSGKLPFDAGVIVQNVATALAIYEAVYKNKPLYQRVVCVTGECLGNPKNLLVPIGTPIKELIEFCQPLTRDFVKIIIGGPMMGFAQYIDTVPIIKTSSAVILLSSREVQTYKEDNCIRCGECLYNCPVNLEPCLISLAVERNNWELAKDYSPLDCIECGLCAYVCPAKRNLVQSIKLAKLRAE